MDRNRLVLYIFTAAILLLIGWLAAEVWWKGIVLSELTFGTVVGAFLAGLFGLFAATYTADVARREKRKELELSDIVMLQAIFAKLIDLDDRYQKNYRHFMISDLTTRVVFGENSFSKPIAGFEKHIDFTIDERSYLLGRFGSESFNRLTNMQGASENFTFLQKKHSDAFYVLFDEMAHELEKDGYELSGAIHKDNMSLMKMMDIDGAFRSLLISTHAEVNEFLIEIIEKYNVLAGTSLRYERLDLSPSAENSQRQEY